MLLIPSAAAVNETVLNETEVVVNETVVTVNEKGIVLDANNNVLYKYDTPEPPALQPGEYIVAHQDINLVLKGATYDGVTFVNPVPVKYEEIELQAEQSTIDPTQTIISGLTGAGAAYLVVRRKRTT